MNRKTLISLIIISGVIIASHTSCYVKIKFSPQNAGDITQPVSYPTTLQVRVIDKFTHKPIKDAIVPFGRNYYTNIDGKCLIKGFAYGDYRIEVIKKGYYRFSKHIHFEKKEKHFMMEIGLTKKEKPPISFSVKGTVIEIITSEGTRSENRYYKIKKNNGEEEYIFDEVGRNNGFQKFINKEVIITGYEEKGFVGWQQSKVEGIYVESIKEL